MFNGELRDLDVWIAENVMELPPVCTDGTQAPTPHYTTDIAAAWEVLDMFERYPMVMEYQGNYVKIKFYIEGESYVGEAKTFPLAVCLAAKTWKESQ